MIRHECLELLAARMTNQLVVTSQSGQRIEWAHLSKHEGNLLVGMMGCAIGVATGLALALPHRKVIALDSDGSVLLSLFNLATLGNLRPKNLVVYVFDNGVYRGSRISYPDGDCRQHQLGSRGARRRHRGNTHAIRDISDFSEGHRCALLKMNWLFSSASEESLLHREIQRPTTDLAENNTHW